LPFPGVVPCTLIFPGTSTNAFSIYYQKEFVSGVVGGHISIGSGKKEMLPVKKEAL
jgi:hypothetical protein